MLSRHVDASRIFTVVILAFAHGCAGKNMFKVVCAHEPETALSPACREEG